MINSKDFDFNFYISFYEDLRKNNINNFEKAFNHLNKLGIKENRFYSFEHSKIYYENSWLLYIKNNEDLKKNIKNEFDAYNHYMNYGKKEKRTLIKININNINIFNWDMFEHSFYNKINNFNFKNKNDSINHFKKIGYKLNLLHSVKDSNLYYNYDWDRYISDYDDLENFDFNKAFIHYIEYGEKENRKIFKKNDIESKLINFNWKFYILANNDLIQHKIIDKNSAIKHFKSNGFKENRLYSQYHYLLYINYNWEEYSKTYKLNLNDLDAFKHYMKNGINNNHKINYSINENNFYKDFFINFNSLDNLNSFEDSKKYYLKLENKIPYSYQHFLIYNLFDWKNIYDNNINYLNTYQIYDHKNLFINYINNYNKFKCKLILNNDLNLIYNFDNIHKLFDNNSLLKNIIKKNIIYNDKDFLHKLFNIQTILKDKLSFNFEFFITPPGFTFSDYYFDNETQRFTFVISSFNNKDNIYFNILSIIYQNYSNWKIYYTNDASTDNTDELFHKIVDEYNIKDKVNYILNKENMKQSYCKYNNYKLLKNNDIVCLLDGDDWLSNNNVLSLLSHEYYTTNNLIIYGGYDVYYNNKIEKSVKGGEYPLDVKKNSSYRKYKNWLFTHLKTGYAWLFKKIPEFYLQINNSWLDRCTDLAEMYCVSEIANLNVKHLNKILYIYNKKNSIQYDTSYYNDHDSKIRKKIENHVKNLTPLKIFLPNIYIINLKNRNDLKNQIIDQLNNFNIDNYYFFEALNGYTNKNIKDKYDEYNLIYDNNLISQTTLTVNKKHINSLGALGIIFSTIELYKKINENKNIDHALILEDDVYFHKNFNILYSILQNEIIDKDFIYLGFNSTSLELNNIFKKNNYLNLIKLQDKHCFDGGIYGAYSYICSRKFRNFIINLGIKFYINNNVSLDAAINIFININDEKYVKNDLTFYIYNEHLFIPEVRKNGINSIRNDNFYKERFINLDNYLI